MRSQAGRWAATIALAMGFGCSHHEGGGTETGVAVVALKNAPADVACLRITVDGTRSVERLFDLSPGQDSVFTLLALPLGVDTFAGYAFAEACSAVGSQSAPTWLSDPVPATLVAGVTAQVTLVMHRASTGDGAAQVSVDFEDDAGSQGDGGNQSLIHVAALPPMNGYTVADTQAVHALHAQPNVLIVATRNQGALCGGGTPALIWRVVLDPVTHVATSVTQQQALTQIQEVRGVIFESSSGALFTGGGWCGSTPPYYSVDHGLGWLPATNGTYPPSSTFSYVEFQSNVYAGTGYAPYHAQIYRWLGNGGWVQVFDVAPPRTMLNTMVVYQNRLFAGSVLYGTTAGCETTVPVYSSTDGAAFQPSSGIPGCEDMMDVEASGDKLLAFSRTTSQPQTFRTYSWNSSSGTWTFLGQSNLPIASNGVSSYSGVLYTYASPDMSSDTPGVYRSTDGVSWSLAAALTGPRITTQTIESGVLYVGTFADGAGVAHIYSMAP